MIEPDLSFTNAHLKSNPCPRCGGLRERRGKKKEWICVPCRRDYMNKRRADNVQRVRAYAKENYWKVPAEERKLKRQAYYHKNKEKVKQWSKLSASKIDREKLKLKLRKKYAESPGYRKLCIERAVLYNSQNPDKQKIRSKRYLETESGKIKREAHRHSRRCRERSVKSTLTLDEIRLLRKIYKQCFYCSNTTHLTLDHVKPIFSGGEHCLSNVVLCCTTCNCSKRDRPLEKWAARTGRHVFPMPLLPLRLD